mmetsp:Transcript_8132/g.10611  ORF Transcript_8132/g.10611 Transcript_8132/m.10611 type:complete len:149 (+) Transcript_8132:58-504(+)
MAQRRRAMLLAVGLCIWLGTERAARPTTFLVGSSRSTSPQKLSSRVVMRGGGPENLVEQLLKPGVVLLDVRGEDEYASGHVDGSLNIPHTQIAARASELPSDPSTPVVVFCARGIRAQVAQDALAGLGYTDVVNGMTWGEVNEAVQQL